MMVMRFIQLPVHFEPDEALTIIAFLDQCREALMDQYGDRIAERLRAASTHNHTIEPIDL